MKSKISFLQIQIRIPFMLNLFELKLLIDKTF